ncbi:hypothetical protein N9Z15_03425 [Akkermansiaceae bacterium]|nr:hypothetical protein [Akkermansiaceae bacterium]
MNQLFVSLMMISVLLTGAQAMTLTEMQIAYQKKVLNINSARDGKRLTLNQGYLRVLSKAESEFQKTGQLEEILEVKKERAAIEKGTWPLLELEPLLRKKLRSARGTYVERYIAFERSWAKSTTVAADKMLTLLDNQKNILTKEGKIEDAILVAKESKKLLENSTIANARLLVDRLTASGRSRAAYIFRRGGDDIEVLVHYDSAGKVSWTSEVANVEERSKGSPTGRQTQAETLGEFIGADGFEADPYVAFDQSVESGKLAFREMHGVERAKSVKAGEKLGVEFSLKENISNAYLTLEDVMAPLASPALHRLTCEYFVPKNNKKLTGFMFRQGDSKDGYSFSPKFLNQGKWTTASCEGVSGSPYKFLRIHFAVPTFDDFKKAGGDSILLRNLKIEHIRFSAFIVEAYDNQGATKLAELDPAKQKMLIDYGKLLPASK